MLLRRPASAFPPCSPATACILATLLCLLISTPIPPAAAQTCPSSCSSCHFNGTQPQCTDCAAGTFLTVNATCVDECGQGYANPSTSEGSCMACNAGRDCLDCHDTNPTRCRECREGFFLQDAECVSTCSVGFFLDRSSGRCRPCTRLLSGCSQCDVNGTVCTACDLEKYLTATTMPAISAQQQQQCVDQPVCSALEYVTVEATPTSRRQCAVCTACPVGFTAGERCPETLASCRRCTQPSATACPTNELLTGTCTTASFSVCKRVESLTDTPPLARVFVDLRLSLTSSPPPASLDNSALNSLRSFIALQPTVAEAVAVGLVTAEVDGTVIWFLVIRLTGHLSNAAVLSNFLMADNLRSDIEDELQATAGLDFPADFRFPPKPTIVYPLPQAQDLTIFNMTSQSFEIAFSLPAHTASLLEAVSSRRRTAVRRAGSSADAASFQLGVFLSFILPNATSVKSAIVLEMAQVVTGRGNFAGPIEISSQLAPTRVSLQVALLVPSADGSNETELAPVSASVSEDIPSCNSDCALCTATDCLQCNNASLVVAQGQCVLPSQQPESSNGAFCLAVADYDLCSWQLAVAIVALVVIVLILVLVIYNCTAKRSEKTEDLQQLYDLADACNSMSIVPTWTKLDTESRNMLQQSRPLDKESVQVAIANAGKIKPEFLSIPFNDGGQDPQPSRAAELSLFQNVWPNAHSRVLLVNNDGTTRPSGDLLVQSDTYINANFIRGHAHRHHHYIAAQNPMENTVSSFWRMLIQQRAEVVLMLGPRTKRARRICHPYWPDPASTGTSSVQVDGLTVKHVKRERIGVAVINVVRLPLYDRKVTHIWIPDFPDENGKYTAPAAFLAAMQRVRSVRSAGKASAPLVVHCISGVGASCAALAIDIMLDEWDDHGTCDVLGTVCQLRQDRGYAVDSLKLYKYLYACAAEILSGKVVRRYSSVLGTSQKQLSHAVNLLFEATEQENGDAQSVADSLQPHPSGRKADTSTSAVFAWYEDTNDDTDEGKAIPVDDDGYLAFDTSKRPSTSDETEFLETTSSLAGDTFDSDGEIDGEQQQRRGWRRKQVVSLAALHDMTQTREDTRGEHLERIGFKSIGNSAAQPSVASLAMNKSLGPLSPEHTSADDVSIQERPKTAGAKIGFDRDGSPSMKSGVSRVSQAAALSTRGVDDVFHSAIQQEQQLNEKVVVVTRTFD